MQIDKSGIVKALGEVKRPVKLVVFKSDLAPDACREVLELSAAIRNVSPRIGLEVYDQVMDRDMVQRFAIERVPVIAVQSADGRAVRFSGTPEGVFLEVLLETVRGISHGKAWFPATIRDTLGLLRQPVGIRVFVETDCPQCRPMAETAIALAFESDYIMADVVAAEDFPELVKKLQIKTLPLIIFGDDIRREGHVTEGEFLELIFRAEGIKPGTAKHCMVCGHPSPDIICDTCKIRIQAEAVEHKVRGEKYGRSDAAG